MSLDVDPYDLLDEDARPVRDCAFRSKSMGWLTADGRFIGARCGASNRCAWCAFIYAIETAQCVYLDSERGGYPRVVVTLTTVNPDTSAADVRKAVEQVVRAVRRRAPDCEYLAFVEWTTGKGRAAGGRRRMHLHVLLKGVHAHHLRPETGEALESVVRRVWSERTGAHRVEVAEIRSPWGAAKYLTHHHNKPSQAPPKSVQKGFKRLRPSKGYFGGRLTELRLEVRALEGDKRVRRAARALMGPEALEEAADWPVELWEREWCAAMDEAKAKREEQRPQLVRRVKIGEKWHVIAQYAEGEVVGMDADGHERRVGGGWDVARQVKVDGKVVAAGHAEALSRWRDYRAAMELNGTPYVDLLAQRYPRVRGAPKLRP